MTRPPKPVSEDEIEALREEMASQRRDLREALAEDLGGEPVDYDVSRHLERNAGEQRADGGE